MKNHSALLLICITIILSVVAPTINSTTPPKAPSKHLVGAWPPWPCIPCHTQEDCENTWKRMLNQTLNIAIEDNWSAYQLANYLEKQIRGYKDCINKL